MTTLTKAELNFYTGLIESTMKKYTLTIGQAMRHLHKHLHAPIIRSRIRLASISMKNKPKKKSNKPSKIWEYNVLKKTAPVEVTGSMTLKDECVYIAAETEADARDKIQVKLSEFLKSLRDNEEN